MQIRNATIRDVPAIHELISRYAEMDRMLFRSVSEVYEDLQCFLVAECDDRVAGCCALRVVWEDLAEIRSLAVREDYAGRGIGRALVQGCVQRALLLGIRRLFTLTLEPAFFEKAGFARVTRDSLPMKVWSDCARCPKQDQCDEIAMVISLEGQDTDRVV